MQRETNALADELQGLHIERAAELRHDIFVPGAGAQAQVGAAEEVD